MVTVDRLAGLGMLASIFSIIGAKSLTHSYWPISGISPPVFISRTARRTSQSMTSRLSGSLPMIAGSNVVRYQPPAGDFSGVSRAS